MKVLHLFIWGHYRAAALVGIAWGATYSVAKAVLAPLPGEWSVPLRVGPVAAAGRRAIADPPGHRALGRAAAAWALHPHPRRTCALRMAGGHADAGAALRAVHRARARPGRRAAAAGPVAPHGAPPGRAAQRGARRRQAVRGMARRTRARRAAPAHRAGRCCRWPTAMPCSAPPFPSWRRPASRAASRFTAQLSLPGGSIDRPAAGGRLPGRAAWAPRCWQRTQQLHAPSSAPAAWRRTAGWPAPWSPPRTSASHEHAGYDLVELGAASRATSARAASSAAPARCRSSWPSCWSPAASAARRASCASCCTRWRWSRRSARRASCGCTWRTRPGARACAAPKPRRATTSACAAHELSPAQAAWLAAMLHNPPVEAARWADTGQINLARTQRIVLAMRDIPRKQRLQLAQELGELPWARRERRALLGDRACRSGWWCRSRAARFRQAWRRCPSRWPDRARSWRCRAGPARASCPARWRRCCCGLRRGRAPRP